MANTRKSTKRAVQAIKRNKQNLMVRTATKTSVRNAVEAVMAKDTAKANTAYRNAIRALSKAASKGAIPQKRAARKMSRLARWIKKTLPAAATTAPLSAKAASTKSASAK